MTNNPTNSAPARSALLEMASQIVVSYLGNNQLPTSELPRLISTVVDALQGAGQPEAAPVARQEPAVPIRKSITPGYLVCLEDGKKLKMLKRHLRTTYDMTPEQYRQKWGLPADYPMVAPNYAQERSVMAKAIGLGRKPKAPPPAPEPAPAPAKRGRRKAAA